MKPKLEKRGKSFCGWTLRTLIAISIFTTIKLLNSWRRYWYSNWLFCCHWRGKILIAINSKSFSEHPKIPQRGVVALSPYWKARFCGYFQGIIFGMFGLLVWHSLSHWIYRVVRAQNEEFIAFVKLLKLPNFHAHINLWMFWMKLARFREDRQISGWQMILSKKINAKLTTVWL